MQTKRAFDAPLIPANRAAELLEELLFYRVCEHIDVPGLQGLEAELWTTMIELDIDFAGQSPMAQARELISRALRRFIEDPIRVFTEGNDEPPSMRELLTRSGAS